MIDRRNKILSDLFKSKDFKDCIRKMRPIEFQDDLKAEVALILCELPIEQVITYDHQGILKYYTVGIIQNLIQSNTSSFYRKYRTTTYITEHTKEPSYNTEDQEEEISNRLIEELKEERFESIIDGLYWYNKEMIKLYIKLGSYREIEKETGIPWGSCYTTIQETINKIKYEFRKQPA